MAEDEFDRMRKNDPHPDIGSDLDLYIPTPFRLNPTIPHYYGDAVRKCFLVIACGLIFLAPVFIGYLPALLPIVIIGVILLVTLAALTNPKKQWVMAANAMVAGGGILFSEMIALLAYNDNQMVMFLSHQVMAIVFLFAMYFSVKTVRAMMLGSIGRRGRPSEIEDQHKEARLKHIRSYTDSGD
jgi:hypothetical protein